MGSLFTKIFLSFWLAALLLGAALFTAERYLGDNNLNTFIERVDAHAETAAALLNEEGMPAVKRWLAGMGRGERTRLLLLDASRKPLPDQPMARRLQRHLPEGFESGVQALRPGLFAVVRQIPGTQPQLHLAAIAWLHSHDHLSFGSRLAIAFVISGLICFGLAALITRPLRRVRSAAQALAEGDLSVRVGYRGGDEVAALARDFDTMADRVRDLLEAQRRLLRDVSHELRSPLTRLRVALELARQKDDSASALERIGREADRLETLVSDVLSLSRLEAVQTHLKSKPVVLADLLAEVAQDADFEAEADGKSVRLKAEPAIVEGDAVLLRSAIENVIRNAIRHTPTGTRVDVMLQVENGFAVIEVCDQGSGVPEQEIDRLFQPFTRTAEARDRASGGYGLGLAISQRAAQAHGGLIEASNRPSGGLRVIIRLPLLDLQTAKTHD